MRPYLFLLLFLTQPPNSLLFLLTNLSPRYAAGKALRKTCPREDHAEWKAPKNRRGAVEMVLASEKGRMPELLPLRHGRMVQSAFCSNSPSRIIRAFKMDHPRS